MIILWAFIILALTYTCILIFVRFHISSVKRNIENSLISAKDRIAISQAWAWCEKKEIIRLETYWGKKRFFDMSNQDLLEIKKIYLPHVIFTVVFILIYQKLFRPTGLLGIGRCKGTPNCSNFAIGCLLRYPFVIAVAKTCIRLKYCHEGRPVSFMENFKN